MVDSRGILRGVCNNCDCSGYKWSGGTRSLKCEACQHPPAVHVKLLSPAKLSSTQDSKDDISESPKAPRSSGLLPSAVSTSYGWMKKPTAKLVASSHHQPTASQEDLEPPSVPHTFSIDQHKHLQPPPIGRASYLSDYTSKRKSSAKFSRKAYQARPLQLTDIDGTGFERSSNRTIKTSHLPRAQGIRKQGWLYSHDNGNDDGESILNQHDAEQLPELVIPPDLLCIGCHKKMKYQKEDGTYYDYCGKTCWNRYRRTDAKVTVGSHPPCIGCGKPRYQNRDGTYYDYCGLSCRNTHRLSKSHMMLPARIDGAAASNVSISRHDEAKSRVQFQKMWAPEKGVCPPVEHVFVITNMILQQQFDSYKGRVRVVAVEQHFHGTSLMCDLASKNALCTDRTCGVCSISRFGFNSNLIGTSVSFQRFGDGFYLAPNSSKCHDYTQGCEVSGYRALLLCEVCPGKKYRTGKNNTSLRAPPVGCDCVFGEIGQDLNYPEIVLYNCGAILPKYIMLYKMNGTHKLV